MISGTFGEIGELFFEIDLIASNGESFQVDALLDTGFTTGWLVINDQDLEELGWCAIEFGRMMKTARGDVPFVLYEGKVLLDGIEYTIPVHAGPEIPEPLLGLQWLSRMRLVVDATEEILTLG